MGLFDTVKKIVVGNVAHDAADSGGPIKIGGKAATAEPTAVSAADRVDAYFDANGKLVVAQNARLQTLTAGFADFTGGGGLQATLIGTKPAWAHAMSMMVNNGTDKDLTVQVRYYSSLGSTSSSVTATHNITVAAGARRYLAPHGGQNARGVVVCPGLGVVPATGANVAIYLTTAVSPTSGAGTVDVTWYPEPIVVVDNIAIKAIYSQNITVGTSAVAVPTTPLEARRSLLIYNNGSVPIYIGDSTVTVNSGVPVAVGQSLGVECGPGLTIYAISGSVGQNVRTMEVA